MCGIGGVVDFNRGVAEATLQAMTAALGRRGPDAHGTLIDGPCGLAHTRLSIIDVAGSPQPMVAPEHGLSLTYNGEIYNYQALRQELEAGGERFRTNGDTEVLLRWLSRSWADALPKFDAMFAFGAWDNRRQRLLLARDALGEKPLFYATPAPGLLVFGSEIKALLQHPAVDRQLDLDALRQALRFRAVYGVGCLHRGVQQLEPGTYLEFSREGLKIGRFHDLIADTAREREAQVGMSEAALIARGQQIFTEAVEERLVADADVPVGAFLSGGLDSSLIVAAMRRARGPDAEVRTYSVGFEGDPHSELPFAQTVADLVGSRHQNVNVGADVYVARMAELSACRDGPVSQPADVAIAQLSAVARQHVKVVLSGEGADEVFAGYPKYAFAGAPWLARKAAATIGAKNMAGVAGMLGMDRRRALVAARALSESREVDRHAQWFSYFDRADLARLLPGLDWTTAAWDKSIENQQAVLNRVHGASSLQRMQTSDCLTWLPGNMLERGDRMTMAEGLEVRPPFLDKALSAFGLALPDRMKVRGMTGKWIVRRWADNLVPPEILARPKWGFRTPLNVWFRGPMRAFLTDHLTAKNGLCATYGDPRMVGELLDGHLSGAVDASDALWTLLSAEVWYQSVYRPLTEGACTAVKR